MNEAIETTKGRKKVTYLHGLIPRGPTSAVGDKLPPVRGHALAVGPPVLRGSLARLVVFPRAVAGIDTLQKMEIKRIEGIRLLS